MANKKFLTLFSNPNFFFHGEQIFFLLHFQTLIACRKSFLYCFTKPNSFHGKILYIIYLFFNPNFFHGKKLPMSVTNPNYFHGKTSCVRSYKP
jgi:hypothetical protein